MKKEPLEHNIYFVIQPLHFVSRILGLSPFHIDPNYKVRNKVGCTFWHIIQATVIILLLLYGLYNSVLTVADYNQPMFNVNLRIVWIINGLASHLTSILTLIFSVTRNRNHMTNMLSLLSRVDNKLFRNNSKQSAYSQQRSRVIMQLWIMLILLGIVGTSCTYSYSDGTWIWYVFMASQMLSDAINTGMMLQYVNFVLMVKQRYQLVKHMLSEAAITDDGNSSTRMDTEHFRNSRNKSNNKTFPIATFNLKSGINSNNLYTIRDLRLICSELCDVLHANNKSYEVLILFDVITILTYIVPTTYSGFMTIKRAIVENGLFQLYLKGVSNFLVCVGLLLVFIWSALCCQKTTEEVNNIFICIQKLMLYPSVLGWSTSELKGFSSQLKNSKFEFNICEFFTLNLHFFCASVSVIFTYIVVLSQYS